MKCKLPLFFLLLLSIPFVHLQAQQLADQTSLIDNFLKHEYPKDRPGAVVLIAKNGEVVYKKAFGLADLKKKKPLKTDMIFELGSMSKQFTSTAILQLVEQKKISLDDPIQKYVDYYPEKKYPITIQNLLSQTSGVPEFFDVDENEFDILSKEHTPKELIEYYRNEPLNFEPGTQFQYSNSNYPLLGVVIEKIAGMPLKEYFERNIFQPLGMNSTSLWYTKGFKKARIPTGYRSQNGQLVRSPKIVGSVVYAAGGIVSTVDDLLTWNEALKNRKFISDFIVNQLTTEKSTLDGNGTGYGFGFFIKQLQGHRTIQHGGNLYGFTSSGLYLPADNLFVCVLSNKSLERTEDVANYLASIMINDPIKLLDKSSLNYEAKKDYLGTYQLVGKNSKIIEIKMLDDAMILDFPQAPGTAVQIVSTSKDRFKSTKAGITIEFLRNEKEEITGFTAEQKGEQTAWQRTK